MTTAKIEDDVLDVLRGATCEGLNVKLPARHLDRKLYERVNEVLTRLGGKWKGGKVSAHVFLTDPEPLLAEVLGSNAMPAKNPNAFFPTPFDLAQQMLEYAGFDASFVTQSGATASAPFRVLEPSAGRGAIAGAVRSALSELNSDLWSLDLVEIDSVNADILRQAQYPSVFEQDFVTFNPPYLYGLIAMNPPFAVHGDSMAYVNHIYRAWDLLSPGGILVAIAPSGFTFREDRVNQEFLHWVERNGYWQPNDSGAFRESGTSVNTVMLWMSKPGEMRFWPKYVIGWAANLNPYLASPIPSHPQPAQSLPEPVSDVLPYIQPTLF